MGQKYRRKVGESQANQNLRKEFSQAFFNVTNYVTGMQEALTFQLGSTMSIQAALCDYLEELHPGAADRIKAILEKHKADFEAEKLRREEDAKKAAALKEQEIAANEQLAHVHDARDPRASNEFSDCECPSHEDQDGNVTVRPADIAPSEDVDVAPEAATD